MRIFIAGATGVLGRRLVELFTKRGHKAAGLVRDPRGEQRVTALGGEPRWADLFDAATLARAAEGCEVIIHAATAIPVKPKTSPQDWALNDRIRREGTRALTNAAARVGAKLYLQQSVVWVARPRDGSPFQEDSPIVCEDPILQSAADAESISREAGAKHGFRVAVLRGGSFYDADSRHTRMLAEGLRRRKLPIIGAGSAVWAMIHTDDMAAAFVAAAEKPQNGIWHVVDNELVTVGDLFSAIAAKLGASPCASVAGADDSGRHSRALFHCVHAHHQCSASSRLRLDAAIPHVSRRPGSDFRGVEEQGFFEGSIMYGHGS